MRVLSFVQIGVKDTEPSSSFLLFQSCFVIEQNEAKFNFLPNDYFVLFCLCCNK
jgi:hypothetical protein